MRKTIIIGNWKMHKLPYETTEYLTELNQLYQNNHQQLLPNLTFGLAVPATSFAAALPWTKTMPLLLSAQDISMHDAGAFTGELAAPMVGAAGATMTIIGHSERRIYHGESDRDVNTKIQQALAANLRPIVCVGETLAVRKRDEWKHVIKSQVTGALAQLSAPIVQTLIIAYEPIWAIGTGVTATVAEAQAACQYVRQVVKNLYDEKTSQTIIIQYGGSVKPANVVALLAAPDIDGALVGGASLVPASFWQLLINHASN